MSSLTRVGRGHRVALMLVLFVSGVLAAYQSARAGEAAIELAARTVVKIYGAGGFRGLESYQTGFLVSPSGHVMTAMSTVLDSDEIDCVLDDGRRYQASLVGIDPRREMALLKLDAEGLPYAPLDGTSLAEAGSETVPPSASEGSVAGVPLAAATPVALAAPGTRTYALSNLFGVAVGDERVSVQQGVISAVVPLAARRGAYEAPYSGNVYVLDFTVNNPGAAGGLLVDVLGHPVGMLGKELRSTSAGIWLNYAIPLSEVAASFQDLISGRTTEAEAMVERSPFDTRLLGFLLVPDILEKTPPFVEAVIEGTPAASGGLRADDLFVAVGSRSVTSCAAVADELARIEEGATVRMSVIRDGAIVDILLGPRPAGVTPAMQELGGERL